MALKNLNVYLWLALAAIFIPIQTYSVHAADDAATASVEENVAFKVWLEGVRSEALERGISPATLDLALADVKPIVRIIKRDRNQPEIKQPYLRYLKSRVSPWRKEKGTKMVQEHSEVLNHLG